jgi:hypothetical protein
MAGYSPEKSMTLAPIDPDDSAPIALTSPAKPPPSIDSSRPENPKPPPIAVTAVSVFGSPAGNAFSNSYQR